MAGTARTTGGYPVSYRDGRFIINRPPPMLPPNPPEYPPEFNPGDLSRIFRNPQTISHPLSRGDMIRRLVGPGARIGLGRLVGAGLGRLVPVLGWLLLVMDLWSLLRAYQHYRAGYGGWTRDVACEENFTVLAGPFGPTSNFACHVQGFKACGDYAFAIPLSNASSFNIIGRSKNCSLGTEGYRIIERFTRQSGWTPATPTTLPLPRWQPRTKAPRIPVEIDPHGLPPLDPQPDPVPVPWIIIPDLGPDPFHDSQEQSGRGPAPQPRTTRPGRGYFYPPSVVTSPPVPQRPPTRPPTHSQPLPLPDPDEDPRVDPREDPDGGFDPPKPRPRNKTEWRMPRVQNRPYVPKPPGPKTRERKMVATVLAGSWLGRLISGTTEWIDFVQTLYKALPKKYRPKGRASFNEKLEAIWEHWDQIDVPKAVEEYIKNELEDMFYGKIGRLAGKAAGSNPYYRRPVGFQTGPAGEIQGGSVRPWSPFN